MSLLDSANRSEALVQNTIATPVKAARASSFGITWPNGAAFAPATLQVSLYRRCRSLQVQVQTELLN
jgi:hypothetical protein